MNYKNYRSYPVKNGTVDVFYFEVEGREVVEIFVTDFLTHHTSSAIFTDREHFEKFIELLVNINEG